MDEIENQTFDEIAFGATASLRRMLIWDDVRLLVVAMLSAVEMVSPRIQSSVEAAARCNIADRGQMSGGAEDEPPVLDTAVSETAATAQGSASPA